jgi:sterol desaturase/sphingolipid hydroxylase (fatty acid hydroxylase superfamily)
MELFARPRPDHTPPEQLDDAALATAIDSLRRKLRSVRASLRTARLAGVSLLAVILAGGFTLLWVGPEAVLPRVFGDGEVVTIPTLLTWWVTIIAVAMFLGIASYRAFAHRLAIARGWQHKVHELERRLEHAEAEAARRTTR